MMAAAGLVHALIQPILGATLAGLLVGLSVEVEPWALAVGAVTQGLAGFIVAGSVQTGGFLEILGVGLAFVSLMGAAGIARFLRSSIGRRRIPKSGVPIDRA